VTEPPPTDDSTAGSSGAPTELPPAPPVEAGARAQAQGPVGETRSIGKCILLAIVTLGIYAFYWTYKTHDEIKRYSGNGVGGVVGLVIYFVLSPVTWFIIPSEVRYLYEEIDGKHSPVRGTTGFWMLLPIVGAFVWFFKVQGALNSYWESHGATPA
jgi:hypothetical protein